MTETQFFKNLKKWFWSFLLGELLVFGIAAIWFSASVDTTVKAHDVKFNEVNARLNNKADIETVSRIEADNNRMQQFIIEELKYIRNRVDENNDQMHLKNKRNEPNILH